MLRFVPNALSSARILAAPLLVALAMQHNETAFTWLLVGALLSDIADGLIARRYHLESAIGSLLDSIGDTLVLFTAVYGIWVFHPEVITDHRVPVLLAIGLGLGENIAALLRYRRLSSFHTLLSKAAGYMLGIFIGVLFIFGFQSWLFWLAIVTSVASNLEEFFLLAVLPEWRSDVRGLWWVLREQPGDSAQ
jgi:CDP-diacylglycerol--glycerol-3-phosphate 3-phosphatidyltransferase